MYILKTKFAIFLLQYSCIEFSGIFRYIEFSNYFQVYLAEKDLFVIRGAGFPSTYEETKTEEPISDYQAPAPVPPPAPEPGTLLFTIQNGK